MITESLIKKYNQELSDILKADLPNENLNLIRKFDSRYKMQINQHFSLQQKYFESKFTKNQRSISHSFLEISSVWFCYEILILICKDYDLQNQLFLVKETRKKGNEFRVSFLTDSNFRVNSTEIIKKFYSNSLLIFEKLSNDKIRTAFLDITKKILNDLILENKKLGKEDYNPSIQTFIDEVSEVERIYKSNFKKQQKNREEYLHKYIDFEQFIGLCYAIRNQYVHNGLIYEMISSNDKFYYQILQNVNDSLNHLVLTLGVAIFKTINKNKTNKNLSD